MRRARPTLRSPHTLAAALAALALGLAAAPIGCNGILGIDDRTLAEAEGGLSCDTYCDGIQAACTASFQEYQSREACIATCEKIPLGAETDTSGNTVGCRMHAVQLAADTGEAGDYCPAAGPAGGNSCGDRCENFCAIFVPTCTGISSIAETSACLSFCQTATDNPAWDPQDVQQKDFDPSIQCNIWHVANAILDPGLHCGHADSTTKCNGSTSSAATGTGSGGSGGSGSGGDDGSGGAGGGD